MKTVDDVISEVLDREKGFVDHPDDRGGATNYGVTQGTLDRVRVKYPQLGLPTSVRALTSAQAREIYRSEYVVAPGFDKLMPLSDRIAAKLVDIGVNMGVQVAGVFLQRALNALNLKATKYADIPVDGSVGPRTAQSLAVFIGWRGAEGEGVMLKALNCLQGARYIELAEKRLENETFVYGWLNKRVD